MSTATHTQLAAEILSKVPSGTPSVLTALSLRGYLNDQIDSLNVAASAVTSVNLSTYQPFVNTASATASAVLLQIYDGSAAATWGVLNSTAHTISIIATSVAATGGISSGSALSSSGAITVGSAGGSGGQLVLSGSTSGSVTISVPGTSSTLDVSAGIVCGSAGGVSGSLTLEGSTSGSAVLFTNATASGVQLNAPSFVVSGGGVVASGALTGQSATVTASTASQAITMGTTAALGLYFATGQPTVSTAAAGSLCLSTGGSGPSTRVWVAGSTGNWIGLVAEA